MATPMHQRILRLIGLFSVVFLLAACDDINIAGNQTPAVVYASDSPQMIRARQAAVTQGAYVLQPGDVVRVFVFESPDLSQSAVVGPDGNIRYPLVGEVRASGRTLRQLESSLTAGLSRNFVSPQVSVTLTDLQSYQFFVNGEVLSPGQFRTDGPISVVQAIALAGGLTAFASRDDIIIYNPTRDGGQRIVFNYDLFLKTRNQPDLFLLPGDTIIVR